MVWVLQENTNLNSREAFLYKIQLLGVDIIFDNVLNTDHAWYISDVKVDISI